MRRCFYLISLQIMMIQ